MAKEAPIISHLYGGRVEVKFHPSSHQYWVSVDGGKFSRKTGCTTYIGIKDKSRPLGIWQQQITVDFLLNALAEGKVIDEALAVEAAVQNDVLKDEAADIGHEIHGWCEHYIRHTLGQPGFEELPEIPDHPEAVTGVSSFLDWQKKHNIEWVSSERVVYSLEHDYIGTMDFEAKIDGKLCVGDFKSSNGFYNGVRMQTAAYQYAANEEKKTAYKGRWAIRLAKYTEKEHMKREARKAEIKEAIARILGREKKTCYPKPYQVFETKFMDKEKGMYEYDMDAFLHCKALRAWDLDTDPFYRGEDW